MELVFFAQFELILSYGTMCGTTQSLEDFICELECRYESGELTIDDVEQLINDFTN